MNQSNEMPRMEINSSSINKQVPLQTTRLDFSTGGFICFLDITDKHEKMYKSIRVDPTGGGGVVTPMGRQLGGTTFLAWRVRRTNL